MATKIEWRKPTLTKFGGVKDAQNGNAAKPDATNQAVNS